MSQKTSIDVIRTWVINEPRLFTSRGTFNSNIVRLIPNDVRQACISLYTDVPISHALNAFINGQYQLPTCQICGTPSKVYRPTEKCFSPYCSLICSRKGDECKTKRFITKQERYGNGSYRNIEKYKKTCLEKYGTENPTQSPEVKEKISRSVKQIAHEQKLKRDKTFADRYGGHPQKTDEIKKLKVRKSIEKYGVDSPNKLTEKINKSRKTRADSFYKQYGDIVEFIRTNGDDLLRSEIAKKFNVSLCVVDLIVSKYSLSVKVLNHKRSMGEEEVAVFIESLGYSIVRNDTTILSGKEIDITIPSHGLGVEYNGIFWHTEKWGRPKNSHLDKTNMALEAGISLLHVFSNEWDDLIKQEIWKSIIRIKLNHQSITRIYARNTVFMPVNRTDAEDFLTENHLQGTIKASVYLGLFYNGSLVQLAAFGNSRFGDRTAVELLRFCTLKNTVVVGGMSKIFKNQPYDSFITYANLRYSQGKAYASCGLTHNGSTPPNYWYLVGNKLESRHKYQKHKLSRLLDNYDSSLSESENMNNNGFYRIWDCGNLKFIYTR